MKRFTINKVLGVALLVLGAILIVLQILAGGKSVIQIIGAGGSAIAIGAMVLGTAFRLENKEKVARDPSNAPK